MENKNFLAVGIIVLVIILLGAGGYFYWKNYLSPEAKESAALKSAGDAAQTLSDSAAKGVLPNMDTSAAVEAAANAADTNPFSDMKTNPFK